MSRDIHERVKEAYIPAYAYGVTLQSTQQATLRSIIEDRAYQSKGILKSISLSQPQGMPRTTFDVICARFAAELCIVGQPVLCAGAHTIEREVSRYANGGAMSDAMHPVLQHSGFLFVPNLLSGPLPSMQVQDWLLEYVAMGGALIVCLPYTETMPVDETISSQLQTYLDATSLRVTLNPCSMRVGAQRNV